MENNSQYEIIKRHLEKYKEITSWEAFEMYGITRLSAIIYNLRHNENYNIETHNITTKNRYGNICNFAKYEFIGYGKE